MTADIAPTANTTRATVMIATLTKRIDGSLGKKMGGISLRKTGGRLGMIAKSGVACGVSVKSGA
jgi:hypothetical protein